MQEALVFQVGLHAALDWFKVGEKISVSEDDTARFGGGAGGENDFGDVLAGEWLGGGSVERRGGCFTRNSVGDGAVRIRSDAGKILDGECGYGGIDLRFISRSDDEFDLGIVSYAGGKLWSGRIVHRHGNRTHQQTRPEGGDPFRG